MEDLFSCDDNDQANSELTTSTSTTPTKRKRQQEKEEDFDIGGACEGDTSEGRYQDEHLIRIPTEGEVPILYLLIHAEHDSYHIQATDTRTSWMGVVTHRQIRENAKSAKASEYEYLKDTENALTKSGCGSYVYSTQLFSTDNSLELSWKKLLISNDIRVFIGSVVMETHHSPAVHESILEYSVGAVNCYRSLVNQLRKEKDRLITERKDALKKLDEITNIKDEIEADLYGKFKMVLNEKKAKIRRLMESLDHVSSSSSVPRQVPLEATPPPPPNEEEDTPSPKHKELGGVSVLNDEWAEQNTSPPKRKRKRVDRKKGGQLQKPHPSERRSRSVSVSNESDEQIGSQDLINMM